MKSNLKIVLSLSLISFFIILLNSCKKDEQVEPSSINLTNGKTTAVFNTSSTYGTLIDQDGNIYKTIKIGAQTWMAENLRTTKYNDGSKIPEVPDKETWSNLKTAGYCNYNNNSIIDSIATYGRLYNWYSINTGKLAPKGGHIPTDTEWDQLIDFIGGSPDAAVKLKEKGNTHWNSPNTGTNETGFTALPGGSRNFNGVFGTKFNDGFWWSSSEVNALLSWYRGMGYKYDNVGRSTYEKNVGFSVRCVKD